MKKWYLLTILIAAVWLACTKEDDPVEQETDFDLSAMYGQLYLEVILPGLEQMSHETAQLTHTLQQFDDNPNLVNLTLAREQWVITTKRWKYCELFNLGPIADAYMVQKVHAWPANMHFVGLNVSDTVKITSDYLSTKGSSSKGLAVIEALLHMGETDMSSLDSLSHVIQGNRRREYMVACAQNIEGLVDEIAHLWNGPQAYVSEFKNSTGSGLNSSLGMLLNEMIASLESMTGKKLGKPMGIGTGSVHPDLVEAPFALQSLTLLKADLDVLDQAFHCGDHMSVNGLDDFLDHNDAEYDGKPLSDQISAQFLLCAEALNAIPSDIGRQEVLQSTEAQSAYDSLRQLLFLIKIRMASELDVVVTFNDSDGD